VKTYFDPPVAEELLQRLARFHPASPRQWGQMELPQMLAHCSASLRMILGELPVKPVPARFIGWLFKGVISSDKPFRHGVPTARELTVAESRELEAERAILGSAMAKLATGPEAIHSFRHPFFGRLSSAQWGQLVYKHLDHHFRQFGG
jgi:hypothetical protein